MGLAEKSALRLGERTIGEHASGVLHRICRRVLVATPRPEAWSGLPVEIVRDEIPEAGPLAGIAAALAAASTRFVAVVGGDMPFLDERLLRAQCALALATGRPVIARVGSRPEPLHAVHLASHASRARRALLGGERRAWGWLDASEIEWMDLSPRQGAALRGVNTPEELELAAAELSGRAGS